LFCAASNFFRSVSKINSFFAAALTFALFSLVEVTTFLSSLFLFFSVFSFSTFSNSLIEFVISRIFRISFASIFGNLLVFVNFLFKLSFNSTLIWSLFSETLRLLLQVELEIALILLPEIELLRPELLL